jgi:predicted esterase
MHGLGDSPESFLSLFGEEELLFPVTTRIVLLKAPMRAVTINQGHVSNSWFDIMSMSFAGDITKTVNMEQVYDSASLINVIIAKELKLVEHSSIFLGGFS